LSLEGGFLEDEEVCLLNGMTVLW